MFKLLLPAFVLLAACNTVQGMGQDVEVAGETVQREVAQAR
ncbi:entericidin A/B family lipoprotein [Roseitranquillus sediminis]|nr:entericidin A/B family lipoprotein [Roseitranquillus sediminis]MBM9594778.1 entericidin A/B family lipoprotein [Roseitranquillus sediminis]